MTAGPEDDGALEPTDPVTAMREGAIALRTMFSEYVAAGFSEHQACVILGTMLAQTFRGNQQDPS